MAESAKIGSFEEAWRYQVLAGLSVSPEDRLRWLEEAIVFASRAGALPRRLFIEKHSKEVEDKDL